MSNYKELYTHTKMDSFDFLIKMGCFVLVLKSKLVLVLPLPQPLPCSCLWEIKHEKQGCPLRVDNEWPRLDWEQSVLLGSALVFLTVELVRKLHGVRETMRTITERNMLEVNIFLLNPSNPVDIEFHLESQWKDYCSF